MPRDLPTRVEAWGALDRLIWQDVDSSQLNTEQLAALRGWVAGGGRLVIAAARPVRPACRPSPTPSCPIDRRRRPTSPRPPSAALLGELPDDATDLPALSGTLTAGRALASVGDQIVAAERPYGSGAVTIIGFDPTADWLTGTRPAEGLWRPAPPDPLRRRSRSSATTARSCQAASQLPTLALPPIGGLIALLGAYILLIGPINYLVLRRLDQREWAWVTMPVLIVVFAVGAYGFGSLLRGSDVIVNEVAIVRGAPGATEGTAQSYLGVFSPSRGTYQVRVPGGALLSSPISGDFFGGDGNQSSLDVLQGDPARVRDLGVGFGSLRTVRAETRGDRAARPGRPAPRGRAAQGHRHQRVGRGACRRRRSSSAGPSPSWPTSPPAQTATVDVALQAVQFGQQLSDKIVGPIFFGDPSQGGEGTARHVRPAHDHRPADLRPELRLHRPAAGRRRRSSSAWRTASCCRSRSRARRRGGPATSCGSCRPTSRSAARRRSARTCCARRSSRPTPRSSARTRSTSTSGAARRSCLPADRVRRHASTRRELAIGLNFGESGLPEPTRSRSSRSPTIPAAVREHAGRGLRRPVFDGLPEVELYDLTAGDWRRLPHLAGGDALRRRRARPATSTRRPARSSSGSSTTSATASASASTCRSRGTSNDRDRPDRGPGQALRRHARRRRRRPGRRGRARSSGWSGPNGAGKTTTLRILATLLAAVRGHRRDRRHVGDPEPRPGPSRPRVHAGRVRGLRRHEGLGVPRLLRPLLRHRPGGATAR